MIIAEITATPLYDTLHHATPHHTKTFVRAQLELEKRQLKEWDVIVGDIQVMNSASATHQAVEKIAAEVL